MKRRQPLLTGPSRRACAALAAAALLSACDGASDAPGGAAPGAAAVHPALAAQTAEFERRVVPVTDRVHVAVGFGLGNSILVAGDDCAFVVDTLESRENGAAAKAAFDAVTSQPLAALIYTHNHADHVFGGGGFAPDGGVAVYSHDTTEYYIDRLISVLRPIIGTRSERMFGNHLPASGDDRFVSSGIGPHLGVGHGGGTPSLLRPTVTFSDRLDVTLCGVRVELVHAPGETNDQLFVWLPDERVLMPGDNVYKAFPNLYTIRGTLHRDLLDWVASLDAMRALRPAHLVPSHTGPVSGEAEVADILLAYRDAIQYVHDQTVRGMNRGLTPDELVEEIELPPHLKEHPYLQELYGTVAWSVRGVFAGYLGWFDGDAATLSPASPQERAAGTLALAGGRDALLAAARDAADAGRNAWAAELATHLLVADPGNAAARKLKARALRALGQRSISPNGRNFYLTQALELEGEVEVVPVEPDAESLALAKSMPIGNFIRAMPGNLNPERSADTDAVMAFRFSDIDEAYSVRVRRGVAEVRAGLPEDADVSLTTDTGTWIEIVAGARGLPAALASGDVAVDGGITQLPRAVAFLALFR